MFIAGRCVLGTTIPPGVPVTPGGFLESLLAATAVCVSAAREDCSSENGQRESIQ